MSAARRLARIGGALEAALARGFPVGGWVPAGLLDLGERVADVRVHGAAGEEESAVLAEARETGRVEQDAV